MTRSTTPSPTPSVCTDSTIEVAKGQAVDVRLYGRKRAGQTLPLVVHFHGGAFVSGDLDNGCTVAEIREALLHCAVYAGVPAAIDAFRAAQEVIDAWQAEQA